MAKDKPKTKQQLAVEIEDMQGRLQEMEDTLEAIRSGAVDAIVTSGPAGDLVFTLEGADHAYHMMVESMNEGAVTLLPEGTILYGNRRFAQMTGSAPSGVVGRRFHEFVFASDHPILNTILNKEGRDCPNTEIRLINAPGADIPAQISASPIELGGAKALTLVITDLSAQRRYEEIVSAEKLSRRILEQAQEAIAVCIDGCIVRANRALYEICEGLPLMQPFDLVFPLRISESEMFSVAMPESGKTIRGQEVLYHRPDGRIFNLILNAGPLVGKDSNVLGTLITLVDITERKRQAAILDGINLIFKEAISSHAEEQLGETCLDVAGEVTASPIGFIGEIGADGKLYDITISNPGWEACRMTDQGGHRGPSTEIKIHGLYGRVLREGKGFFTNEPFSEPDSIGLPPGHPPLASFLGVPLIRKGRAIGLVAVGNREGGYGQEELEALEAIAPSIAEAFLRKRAEEELRVNEEQFRVLIQNLQSAVALINEHGEFTVVNRSFLRMFELPADADILNVNSRDWSLWQVFDEHGALLDVDEHPVRKATLTGRAVQNRLVAVQAPGSTVCKWILVSAEPILNAQECIHRLICTYHDITERKQAEHALQTSEARLRFALETSHTGAWDLDLVDHTAFRSLEHDRIFGYAELLPQWTYEMFLDHVLAEDRAAVDAKFRHATETQSDWSFECRIRRTDGEVRWIWAAGRHRADTTGALHRMAGIVQDITERKLAEEALRESREDLDRAQAVGQIGSWRLDVQRNVLTWSDENHRIFGVPKGTPMSYETFLGIVHPDDRQYVDTRWKAGLAGEPYDIEHRIVADGQLKWVREKAYLEFDDAGKLLGGFGITQDITERKRAEEDLLASEERYRSLFDSMTEGFAIHEIVTDAGGRPVDYRFLSINSAFERLTSLKREDIVGRLMTECLPDENPEWIELYGKVALTGEPLQLEKYSPALKRWYEVLAFRNASQQFAVIFMDVTGRKKAEESLLRSEARFRLLSETAGRLLSTEDPQGLINELCRDVMEFLDCQAFFNFMVDEHAGRLRLNACAGIPEAEIRKLEWLDYGVAVCGCVARDQARIIAEDIFHTPDVRTELVRSYGIQAYCCHPLKSQDRLIGTLSFGTKTRARFTPEEVELMRVVADEVAIAVQRVRIEHELRQSEEALHQINASLEQRVRERKRIAGVLHDEIAQTLAATRMRLDLLQGIAPDQQDQQTLKEAKALLVESINETRALMMDIGNPVLYDMGLKAACEALTERLMERHPIRIRCDIRDAYKRLDPDVNTILFQLIRELLNNVVKHSHAQNAHVAIDLENGHFRVKVTDDGVGFDTRTLGAPTIEGGYGLYSIRERLIAMDGSLSIESAPGTGTVVTAVLPAALS